MFTLISGRILHYHTALLLTSLPDFLCSQKRNCYPRPIGFMVCGGRGKNRTWEMPEVVPGNSEVWLS